METDERIKQEISVNGYTIIDNVFTGTEVNDVLAMIGQVDMSGTAFRKTEDLFAIRRFLKEIPDVSSVIFSNKLSTIISTVFGKGYFAVKSIYFDKPEHSNWFVAWHQDLTIAVDRKADIPGYGAWTNKNGQFAVQAPVGLLEQNFTIRIHLDDANEHNGALKVIPGSHLNGICRSVEAHDAPKEVICNVNAGGIMLMRPLLFHASGRTTNAQKRRVIHIEFSNFELPEPLQWAERS